MNPTTGETRHRRALCGPSDPYCATCAPKMADGPNAKMRLRRVPKWAFADREHYGELLKVTTLFKRRFRYWSKPENRERCSKRIDRMKRGAKL